MSENKIRLGIRQVVIGLWIVTVSILSVAFWLDLQWMYYTAVAVSALVAFGAIVFADSSSRSLLALLENVQDEQTLKNTVLSECKNLGVLGQRFASVLEVTLEEISFCRNAIKSIGMPVVVCRKDNTIAYASNATMDFLKKKETDIVGVNAGMAFYNKKNTSTTENAIHSKQNMVTEKDVILWDKRVVPAKIAVNIISNTKGDVLGSTELLADISDVREQQKEVLKHNEQMVEASREVSDLAQRLASASEELSASADEQARGAREQKKQTDTVATAMEEMTATVMEVAQNAAVTSSAADEASKSAAQGVMLVTKAVDGINNVSQSSAKLGAVLGQLNSQAEEIGRIINVINDIADQTNLLALNAAIEAARAGEAGRGFAVVADEVRKLAEKTMGATKEVEVAIHEIQQRSNHAVDTMKQTEKQVNESTKLSNGAGLALEDILKKIEDMVLRVSQIATAAEEQSSAAEEINQNIEEIARIAHEADEGADQAAHATRDLAELSQELLSMSMDFSADQNKSQLMLKSSGSEMRGVLPKMMQDYVKERFNKNIYDQMESALGNPVFLPTASYPDTVLHQMAEVLTSLTGKSQRDIFMGFGKFTIPMFYKMYRRYFKAQTLKDFYLHMNDTHTQLTKDHPGIKPPKFTYEDKGNVLFMNYHSKRGLFDYFEGILNGAAEYMKERVKIVVKPLDKDTARAEITFL
ncbi:methyl-accepting chemotaxis protein [Desulfovibrio inopinatus]|uniref:methyl-accepting chemotaxis protein n=1 Tax=Desulfovibrio inopinatus TaxID=102109 RepID=UPI000487CC13|nr:methyl-accepting chemotaxis protein [Desulfovibrio inopinatus]